MVVAVLTRRSRFYNQPDPTARLGKSYQDRAEFFSLMNGEVAARDIAKGNNLAPQAGAPTTIITPWGKSLHFDGTTSHLQSARGVEALSQFTVMAWVRPGITNTGYTRILETDYATSFYLGSNTASQYAWIVNGSSLEGCIGGQQVVGQRDFLCGVFDGTNRILYVNGVQVGSASATAPSVVKVLQVGYPGSGGAGWWNGDIDTAGVFNRAFAASTIWQIYQDPNRIFEAPKRYIGLSISAGSITGTLARTNNNDTLSASGTTTVTGSLAKTNANDTVSASGTTTVTGSLAKTNANDTCNASGSVGSSITGTLARTNANDTVVASGTTTIVGSLAKANANDTSAASGTTTVVGSLAKTNSNDTCAASGTAGSATITGSLSYTNRNDTLAASGTTTIKGSLAYTNNNDRLSAFGTINNGIVFEAALLTGATASDRLKKPGIPSDTPDWLKNSLEILEGRRGNAINPPSFQTLTFSATPTKAECDALYAYVNTIRDALEQLLNRMDG